MNFEHLLSETIHAVSRCLFLSLSKGTDGLQRLSPNDHFRINSQFKFLSTFRNSAVNTYLTKGSAETGHASLFIGGTRNVQKNRTRISSIIATYLKAILESAAQSKTAKDGLIQTYRISSPIRIAQFILTDPEALETKQVAEFYSKLFIMNSQGIEIAMSQNPRFDLPRENIVTFDTLDRLYKSIGKYVAGRDNFSKSSAPAEHFLTTLFAAHGILDHRISWPLPENDASNAFNGSQVEFENLVWQGAEFRKSDGLQDLPSIAELANFVFGVPIAISGLNELLNGGLKQGAGEGTVSLIRGGPGSGKTTLSISLQRSFEALGIPSLFVSTEESETAIMARRSSVLNLAQKSHSAFINDSAPHRVISMASDNSSSSTEKPQILNLVQDIADELARKSSSTNAASAFSRIFVVIDGIHNFLKKKERSDLAEFVNECRRTGCHVLLTSSDSWMMSKGMEYLVDNYFHLSSSSFDKPMPHIQRKIRLVKTRHQSSMIGEHWMKFQDEGDLLFIPNFSETLKAQSRIKQMTANRKVYSKPFSLELLDTDSKGYDIQSSNQVVNLKHYEDSVSLVYGRGSSSKTSFCLRLLCAPNLGDETKEENLLIVSFLYPYQYYQSKISSFRNKYKKFTGSDSNFDFEVIHFSPGMITAEEVFYEVSERLLSADVSEHRYTGVLFDGLHNIFVQFPQLENHSELWSALVNLIRSVGVKTVLTFTDFEVWGARTLNTVDYENKRAKPLLIALSQSLDFGFALVPQNQVGDVNFESKQGQLFAPTLMADEPQPGIFNLTVFMAIGQPTPTDKVRWDRSIEQILIPE